ncbi:MAG: hypothetical protein ACI4GA_06260 [Acutalibacteraceae bacterium]|nr:hypothetical protein [Oscillospiraceae bacterium]
MKKLIVPVLALLIISLFVACSGRGGENTYTGDFKEYSNLSDSSSGSLNTSSGDTASSTVTVPLTTQVGGTVPEVTTTQPTTEFSTIDYTPIVPDTTKPIVNTTYYSDPNSTTNSLTPLSPSDTTSSTTNSSDEKKHPVKIKNNETYVFFNTQDNKLVLKLIVQSEKIKGKPKASSGGDAIITVDGKSYQNRRYNVLNKLDPDGGIVVELPISNNDNINFVSGDTVTVTLKEGAIKTDKNYINEKFTSGVGYY